MSGRRDAAIMMFTVFGLALLWGLALEAPGAALSAALLLLPAQLRLPALPSPRVGWLGAGFLALGGAGALAQDHQPGHRDAGLLRHPLQLGSPEAGGRARPSGGGAAFLWWGGCHRDALVV